MAIKLFPAYAGVIPNMDKTKETKDTFPRIRGGDPNERHFLQIPEIFSPHTRG